MKKILRCAACALFLISISSYAFAERQTVYISPNNDGVQDDLTVPLKIYDRRYITAWSLIITDRSGKVVRTIGNKYEVPYKMDVKGFFKRLFTPKQGVVIPETVTWHGALDNGETAPDGDYYYYFTATDDNGNIGYSPDIRKTSPNHVVVDNTPPNVVLGEIKDADKIFGEGAKAKLLIKQSGSKEDEWTAKFKNASGTEVKTYRWVESEPPNFSWDGKNDGDSFVADGVYSYSIAAKDRAGNVSAPVSIQNIIYSAEKPVTNITILGGKYFSPGTDSPMKDITLGITVPVPAKSSGNKLTAWNISIIDEKGNTVAEFKPATPMEIEAPPTVLSFDGKDNAGQRLSNGSYQARLTAKYLNGYEPSPIKSPVFVLDTSKPQAVVRAGDKIFSPDGDGVKETITVSQMITPKTGAPVKNWKGKIVSASDPLRVVKEYDLGEFPPSSLQWDGIDSDGKLAPDGDYKFVLSASDLAGNSAVYETPSAFTLDTSKTEVILTAQNSAFSPNNDRVKDTIGFSVMSKIKSAVAAYDLLIKDNSGKTVRTVSGSRTLPQSFTWDGKGDDGIICADGSYLAELSVRSESGSAAKSVTQPFVLDTKYPSLLAEVPWTLFSPDGDGKKDVLPVSVKDCTEEDLWTAQVLDANKKPVRSYSWKGKIEESGREGFTWDGTDESGNTVPYGNYSMVIRSEDLAGNSFRSEISKIIPDVRPAQAYVTTSLEGISPNGDGVKDTQTFTVRTSLAEGISSWKFDVNDEAGKTVRSWTGGNGANLPAEIVWDGLTGEGKPAEGVMTGSLEIIYAKGNEVHAKAAAFVCTVTPPELTASVAPEFFSPDNDGSNDDLFIKLSGKTKSNLKSWSFSINDPQSGQKFWTTGGTSAITERIVWDGLSNVSKDSKGLAERVQSAMDYPFVFTASDDLGMSSTVKGVIGVDVLVIRDGNVLKMAVPSIIFRSDHADFKTTAEVGKGGLDPEKAASNERVLKRVEAILSKFSDYKVTIVGHANKITAYEEEETQDNPGLWGPALIPLSQARAEYVKNYLVKFGIRADRLTTEGKGGTQLVADWQDKNNNWKNRRVEFILNK
ncbi:FlgD immunoglobulin-like domain containing protein [Treponema parvum]|uniref:FlgD immunoglobulin-like domain containing protein n=1 Tax=Treponema parvum TaxID=138851 RepID=UPI001AEBF96A|nr:FlgD immunoglobulin-like domain containing protein [Treponema parvum]QTQ15712.1 OmpA family protein [Treponema parvum]